MARLQTRLMQALVVPAGIGFVAIAMYANRTAQGRLEAALAQRLTAVASLVSQTTNPRVGLLDEGDEETRTHRKAKTALIAAAEQAGVERIVVAHFDGQRALVDSAGRLPVGQEYGRARFDRVELATVAAGKPAASVLFGGPSGRPYKTGYAPFFDRDEQVMGFVAVEAAADYTDALWSFQLGLGGVTAVALIGLIAAATYVARTVAGPLAALSGAAKQIGDGDLAAEIPCDGPTEAVVLANTMRTMARSLQARDEELQMMLAGIAHEVRNPLGGIELFGGLLKEDLAGDRRAKHVDKILKELGTLSMVVNDFLHFARRTEPEPRQVSGYDMIFEVVGVAEKSAQDRGVKLSMDVPASLTLTVDLEAMKRALLNLAVMCTRPSVVGAAWMAFTTRLSKARFMASRSTVSVN
ncbi:MAG: histidine kinase dimerization/phospho-acceptor domain-containing protein, partial [Myxococcota bacterium]